jgi:arylsulfatase A-like enzyme
MPSKVRASLTAFAVLTLAACSPPPDVILITVDTLRADRLGCYGSSSTRTPNVDALAAEGLLFENAVAPLPETRPSHYTLFTSLYPGDHGVVSNAAPAADGLALLPALFGDAGYATAGVAGCALFDAQAGADLGFATFDPPEEPQRTADAVVDRALAWLAGRDRARPFFLWVHLFDPHMPYVPPPPLNGKSAPADIEALPGFTWPRLLEIAGRHGGDLPRSVLDRARDLYDGEVEFVDQELGRLFAALRAEGLYDNAVILLTADHGECFENGVFFDHSQCLGEGALAVPLILRFPARVEPGRTAAPVEHLDVAPTLLRLAGLEVPPSFQGRGLLERREAEAPYAFFQQPLYRRADVTDRQEVLDRLRSVAGEPTRRIAGDRLPFGVRRGPWKYVRSGDQETLYNLADDPAERLDVAAREPAVVRELRRAARQWMKDHPVKLGDASALDPALVERLEALGYL